ncbi:MAG: NDP-sugar synthase [Candidatus Thorarchaeota archaeon]|nr:MAG: NDP-sugar synthase [Candidatus Thorarchaeota archaeon]
MRVDPITRLVPKSLISCAGMSTLERLIQSLNEGGVQSITVGIGWLGNVIENHLKTAIGSGQVQVIEVPEWKRGPLQTLVSSSSSLDKNPFIVCPADMIVSPENVGRLIDAHLSAEGAHLLTLSVDSIVDKGTRVQVTDEGRLIRIGAPSEVATNVVRSAMMMAVDWTFRQYCTKALEVNAAKVTDAVNLALESGATAGMIQVEKGSWRDLDDLDAYIEANRELLEAMPGDVSGGLYLHPRDTLEIGNLLESESGPTIGAGTQIVGPVFIARNVRIGRECHIGPSASIGTDTVLGDHCDIRDCMLFGGAQLPEGNILLEAIVCGEAILEKGANETAK